MSDQSRQTYIPLKEAVEIYGISEEVLLERVESGQVASGQLPDGELLVAEADVDPKARGKAEILAQDYAELQGQPITVTQAVEKYGQKYGFHRNTLLEWVKHDYITVYKPGYRMILNEAEVVYCAEIYQQRKRTGTLAGVPLLDKDGSPYELKYPELAARKRKQRRERAKQTAVED